MQKVEKMGGSRSHAKSDQILLDQLSFLIVKKVARIRVNNN